MEPWRYNDVHVGISSRLGYVGSMYEIVLGGWLNTRSVIRRGAQGPELASANVGLTAPGG